MVRLIALEGLNYGIPLRYIKFGEEFDAEPADAGVLKMLGRADDAPAPAQTRGYKTREVKSEDESGEKRGGGRYNRSDMRAED